MENSNYIVNRLIQGGIYFFEVDERSKNRPYLIVSKENGYGMDVLAFLITKQFISSKVSLPVVLNGEISFVRISGTREIPLSKVNYDAFYGLLRPDVFSIAIQMYMRRFAKVNEEELDRDLNNYLLELEKGDFPYLINPNKYFRRIDYLNDISPVYKEDDRKRKDIRVKKDLETPEKEEKENIKLYFESDKMIEDEIIKSSYWTLYHLKEFREKSRKKNDRELISHFHTSLNVIKYLRKNCSYLISLREQEQRTRNRR